MKDRIIQFLASEKISPAEFADKIGVQRSSMSHILNGRNYPSAAFIQKMLQAYPAMNPRWLMIGDGTMNMESTAAEKVTALPDFRKEEPIREIQTELFRDQEAETSVSSVPETTNVPLITDPLFAAPLNPVSLNPVSLESPQFSDSRHPSESVLNQSIPASGRSEEQENNSVQPNQSSLVTSEQINGKEIEQILFFYKDKTFSIYRPS